MNTQKITIQNSNDPFDVSDITVTLKKGVRVMSSEPYTLELLKQHGLLENGIIEDKENIDKLDGIITGNILKIYEDHALIDIGDGKHTAVCNFKKENNDVIASLREGESISVLVTEKKGEYTASISEAGKLRAKEDLINSIGDKSVAFNGQIIERINQGGFWVDLMGVRCFMPGSLAGLNKISDFDSLVGKFMTFMPINYSNEKKSVVVSHREYLRTMIPHGIKDLKSNIKEKITGTVTGTAKFGVFAEFNMYLTGLIPIENLDDESMKKFKNREIKSGDSISFWVDNIISDKKIILSQTGPKYDPWDDAADKYKPMKTVSGKVTKTTNYGAFVQLEPGISGLIHKSQLHGAMPNRGDEVMIKIIQVHADEKKISMTLV